MMNELLERYPSLRECREDIIKAQNAIINCYKNGGKVLVCGNGGSASDCDHIVGELMKGFLKKRPLSDCVKQKMKSASPFASDYLLDNLQQGLPAISLPSFSGLNSAVCNDIDADLIYAQSVLALGKKGDVLICISTSGNAKNTFFAAATAKACEMMVISLSGKSGGRLKEISDVCILAPSAETYKIQELHLPIYHYLCAKIEEAFFNL